MDKKSFEAFLTKLDKIIKKRAKDDRYDCHDPGCCHDPEQYQSLACAAQSEGAGTRGAPGLLDVPDLHEEEAAEARQEEGANHQHGQGRFPVRALR